MKQFAGILLKKETMRKYIVGILAIVFIVLVEGCFRAAGPRIRVRNSDNKNADIIIRAPSSDHDTLYVVSPGETTDYLEVNAGTVTAVNVMMNQSVSFPVIKSETYTVVITADNPPMVYNER